MSVDTRTLKFRTPFHEVHVALKHPRKIKVSTRITTPSLWLRCGEGFGGAMVPTLCCLPPFVRQYPVHLLIIFCAHPLLSYLASCRPVLAPCVIALSLFRRKSGWRRGNDYALGCCSWLSVFLCLAVSWWGLLVTCVDVMEEFGNTELPQALQLRRRLVRRAVVVVVLWWRCWWLHHLAVAARVVRSCSKSPGALVTQLPWYCGRSAITVDNSAATY